MPSHDLRLLRDCLDDKPGSWDAFVARFSPYLSRVCGRVLAQLGRPSGSQEAQDALQDLFVCFLEDDRKALRGYRGEAGARVPTYLAAVAVRRLLKARAPQGIPLPTLDPPAGIQTPPEILEARELRERLRGELEVIPPQMRLALTLQGDGASVKEVGQALGLSPGAAAQLLYRARGELRRKFDKRR